MSFAPGQPGPSARTGEPESIDSLIDRFERLWGQGQRPTLDAFLPTAGEQRRRLLVELVHVELELRLKAGEAARVEEYLERFQELAGDAALEWDLIVAEHGQRARREPELSLTEYVHRFPHRQAELARWQPVQSRENDAWATLQTALTPTPATPSGVSARWPAVPGYQILGELGRGGMGAVYKAWQPSLKRVVALKVIRAGAGREEHGRFRVEAEAVARLRHPGIVQIYEIGAAEGEPYLTLEYVEGGSLSKRLDGSPWPTRKAAALVRALAEAIHHAHQQGVVHRDLKPGNVLLGPEDRPLIGDFGLAKLLLTDSDEHTRTGVVLGTPCYMSPEQACGLVRDIGPATDIHALGAILYELLTGRPPFRGESGEQTVQLVRSEEPVAPRRLQPRVGRDLETVCLKCLRKRPAERYASAAALADDLRRHLDGEPVRARPPSVWRRSAAWARRRPVAAVLLLAAGLLVPTVIAALSWHTARLSTAVDQATREVQRLAEANAQRARHSEYAWQMRLAQQSLRLGETTVLPILLDRFQPPTAEDLRGFEWRHLAPHRQPTPRGLRAHKAHTSWLAYSPDGRFLATAGIANMEEYPGKVWDAATGALRFQVRITGPSRSGRAPAAFGPGTSGWLAAGAGNTVTRWDLQTGKPLPGSFKVGATVSAIAAHPDGRRLFVASSGPLSVWDAPKGTCLATFPESSRGADSLSLFGDGRGLVSIHSDSQLRCWDVAAGVLRGANAVVTAPSGLVGFPRSPFHLQISKGRPRLLADWGRQEIFWPWGEHLSAPVTAVAVSPAEELLATGHADGVVRFWDVPSRAYRGQLRWQAVEITALALSPDGKSLAAGTRDGLVYQLSPPLRQQPDPLHPALQVCGEGAFSPDGKTIAVPCADRTVQLIDIADGTARIALRNFLNHVTALAFAPDGRTLATREWGADALQLWDGASGELKATVQGGRDCFAFAPTGSLLALGHEGVALVDGAGSPRGAVRRAGTATIALAFTADGRTLATTDGSPTVELWDVSAGRLAPAPTVRHRLEGPVRSLAFLPDGILVTGEANGVVRFWRPAGDGLTAVRPPLRCPDAVTRLAVSRDGKTLLTHVPLQHVCCWDLTTHKRRTTLHHATAAGGWSILAPDPDRFAFLGKEGLVEFWQCKTATAGLPAGQPLWAVSALAFTPDGQTLLTASRRPERTSRSPRFGGVTDARGWQGTADSLRCWEAGSGKERPGLSGLLTLAPPELLALAPDGRLLAAGAVDGSVWLWDRRQGGRPLRRLFVSERAQRYALKIIEPLRSRLHTGNPLYSRDSESVQALAFSPDGRWLAAAGSRGTVTVWENGAAWREVRRFSLAATGPVWVAFSPSGDLVVPQGGQLRFLDGDMERFVLGRQEEAPALCVAFAKSGGLLAVAHQDRRIRLWDLTTKEPVGELIGHLDQVTALAFAPDGKTLASASHDRTVRLWSVAALVEVAALEQHRGKVFCLAFSPDGTTLASGGEGQAGQGEVYLWRAPRR